MRGCRGVGEQSSAGIQQWRKTVPEHGGFSLEASVAPLRGQTVCCVVAVLSDGRCSPKATLPAYVLNSRK